MSTDIQYSPHLQRIFAARPDFFMGEGEKFKYRRQAAAAYPLLAPFFPVRFGLRAAIDGGKELSAAIQSAFALSKVTVSRLAKIDFDPQDDLSNNIDLDNRLKLARALNDVDPNWWPKETDSTLDFVDAVRFVHFHLAPYAHVSANKLLAAASERWRATTKEAKDLEKAGRAQDAAVLLKDGNMWRAFLERLNAAAYPPYLDGAEQVPTPAYSFDNLVQAAFVVRDMVADFAICALYPAAAKLAKAELPDINTKTLDLAYATAGGILFGGKSAAAILELASRWSTSAGEIQQIAIDKAKSAADAHGREPESIKTTRTIVNVDHANRWPAAIGSIVIQNYRIRALISTAELKEESKRLNHCVGRSRFYAEKIIGGEIMILSVRSLDDKHSFSTAEIEISPNAAVNIRQHRARKNSKPKQEIQAFICQIVDGLNRGQLFIDREALEAHAKKQDWVESNTASFGMGRDRIAEFIGYDWRAPGCDRVGLESWETLRNPATGGVMPAPWLSARFSTDPEKLARVTPGFHDLIMAVGPDGEYAYNVRMNKVVQHFSLDQEPAAPARDDEPTPAMQP